MFNKSKRILWLLNHRTLMPFEVPVIQKLGFEVFIPKVIPKRGFRSGTVDYAYDASLTLPPKVLQRLNEFDFYAERWPSDIVTIVNRYFGAAFITPHLRQVSEAIDHFEGQIVFRAFGLENENSYGKVFVSLYGSMVLRKIKGIQERFWFGEGYDNLHECEDPLFKERALFLPIGVPEEFFAKAKQWSGTLKKILFVCPNAVTDPYYSRIYKKFKQDLGDLPHVIVGAQDAPVLDPNVLGFVSDEELHRLYLECALLYYPSTEVRHVHYSPIEAAINGMPVVFYAGSLLDRLSRGTTQGRVDSATDARALVERLLAGDRALIQDIKDDQQEIAYHFSHAYCDPMWRQQMEERGFLRAIDQKSKVAILFIELWRTIIKPFAHGRIKVNPHRRALTPSRASLTATEAKERYGSSLFDGISFQDTHFPPVVDVADGVGANEGWGRWSNSEKIVIVLKHLLQGSFELRLQAVGYGKNAGAPVEIWIGGQLRTVRLDARAGIDRSIGVRAHFDLSRPANVIEIKVPYPTRPEHDSRTVGIGIVKLSAALPASLSLEQAKRSLGCTLKDGLDFTAREFPSYIDSIEGLCGSERWGRWSNGDKVSIILKHVLQGRFRIFIRAIAYGRNAGVPLLMRIGGETKTFRLSVQGEEGSGAWLHFELKKPSNVIEIEIPHPTRSSLDARALGIGLIELRAAEPVLLSVQEARTSLGSSLAEGIDFSVSEFPSFVQVVEGLSGLEPWGRWSVGDRVRFELNHTLEGPVRLLLRGVGFGPNIGLGVAVKVGDQVRTLPLPAWLAQNEELALDFNLRVPSNVIEFKVPHPTRPEKDDRLLGIGFFGLRSAPITGI